MTARDRKRALRAALPPGAETLESAARTAASQSAVEHLARLEPLASARILGLFSALPDELDPIGAFGWARQTGKLCAYPRCMAGRVLEFALVEDPSELVEGRYGIREPRPSLPAVRLDALDAVLVPGLAFDRRGGRLGRGAGYYDRAFGDPQERPLLVGFTYSGRLIDEIPLEAHDQRMDALVTEREVIQVGGGERAR